MTDSYYHIYNIIYPIVSTGHVPMATWYTYFPGHHIMTAIYSVLMNIDVLQIYFKLGGLIVFIGALFVYITAQRFTNERVALIAVTLYFCCDYVIYYAAHSHQQTFTFFMILQIIFLMLFSLVAGNNMKKLYILFLISGIWLAFSHHYSIVIMLIAMGAIVCAEMVSKYANENVHKLVLPSFLLVFLVIIVIHWLFYSQLMNQFIDVIQIYASAFGSPSENLAPPLIFDELPLFTLLLKTLSTDILIFFATIGFFLFYERINVYNFSIVILSMSFLGFIGIGAIINVKYLLPSRIFLFLEGLCFTFLAAYSVYCLSSKFKSARPMIIIALVVLAFFANSGAMAGMESSLFSLGQPYQKFYYTPQDCFAECWMNSEGDTFYPIYYSMSMFLDESIALTSNQIKERTIYPIPYSKTSRLSSTTIQSEKILPKSYVLFSEFDMTTGFMLGYSETCDWQPIYAKITIDEIEKSDKFAQIYANGINDVFIS
jgi:hypothetical protein